MTENATHSLREFATNRWDLPHEAAVSDERLCKCGRWANDELHRSADLTEKAGVQPAPFITEKGA